VPHGNGASGLSDIPFVAGIAL